MFEDHNDTLYEIIKSIELITAEELKVIMESQIDSGKSLADVLIDTDIVKREKLLSIVAEYLG